MNECYARRKSKNLCVKCGKRPPREGRVLCKECADKDNARRKEDVKWYKERHICYKCGKERVYGDEKICPECLVKAYISNKKSREKIYGSDHNFYVVNIAKLKEQGLCRSCQTRKVAEGHTYCPECLAKQNARSKKRRERERLNKVGIDRSERPSYGLCYTCGQPLDDPEKRLCAECCRKAGHKFDGHRNKNRNKAWQQSNQLVFGGVLRG